MSSMVKVMNYENALNEIYNLVKKHRNLFSTNAYDISIPPGWINLVDELFCDIQAKLKDGEKIQIVQIKDKFGKLQIYYGTNGIDVERGFVFDFSIQKTEDKSMQTCIICGNNTREYLFDYPHCSSHSNSVFDFGKPLITLAKFDDKMASLLNQK